MAEHARTKDRCDDPSAPPVLDHEKVLEHLRFLHYSERVRTRSSSNPRPEPSLTFYKYPPKRHAERVSQLREHVVRAMLYQTFAPGAWESLSLSHVVRSESIGSKEFN